MAFQAVKGCEDYFPSDYVTREAVFAVLRKVARSYGFLEVSTPAMESVELLAKKSGEEIKQQLFVLEKKGSEENALRFDLTVPMTRLFMEKQKELPKPVKWFGLERMWRYEAPQKGRLREFYQLSVELFGAPGAAADAEVINVALDCLRSFGISQQDVVLKLNNRKLLQGLVSAIVGQDNCEAVIRAIDKQSKVTPAAFREMLSELGVDDGKINAVTEISAISGKPGEILTTLLAMELNAEAKQGLDELEAVLALVPNEWVRLDLSLARGLAYYTGTVFEVFDAKGELRAILGGGRYDNLVELFGGQPEAAVGFGIGFTTLSLLLSQKGLLPKPSTGPDYYIAALGSKESEKANEIAAKLRRAGATVETDLLGRKLDKQIKYANVIGSKRFLCIGPQELASGIVKVKDMVSGKDESKLIKEL